MNFAPYQDDSPEANRTSSPAPPSQAPRGHTPQPPSAHPKAYQPPPATTGPYADTAEDLPDPENFENNQDQAERGYNRPQRSFGNGIGADERNVDVFSTSLPMRLDYEACMAYLLLPPAGGALLLMLEHKSDYVRFHAWQSSLVFTFLFLVHLIFSFSRVISFMLLAIDLILIAYLASHAYRDADSLDRCEIPYFGRLASSFVDEE